MTMMALRRELGRWDLTAIGVNQVIGGSVFVVPALLAAHTGAWSPWIVVAVGLASMLIALSFAEVASRFDATGGPYLYARTAFGQFVGFEIGWMAWITRVASWAFVLNVVVSALGFYWSGLTSGFPRAALVTAIVVVITAINLGGIRQSSLTINVLTVGKLTPLLLFIVIGLFGMDLARFDASGVPAFHQLSASALPLIAAFGGYENVPVSAGEARDPRATVPFALVTTIVVVTLVMALIQAVAVGTSPNLATSDTPLADAATIFWGPVGAVVLTAGAVISAIGNNMGGALAGSRFLFALAEQGDLPPLLARVHPRFRTPVTAILVTSVVTLVLAISGTFASLIEASGISRLIVYVATCASTLRLRGPQLAGRVRRAQFTVPLGPVIPGTAIAISLAILGGATTWNLLAGAVALGAGALVYLVVVRRRAVIRS